MLINQSVRGSVSMDVTTRRKTDYRTKIACGLTQPYWKNNHKGISNWNS